MNRVLSARISRQERGFAGIRVNCSRNPVDSRVPAVGISSRWKTALIVARHRLWHGIRLPLVTVLTVIEPLVRAVLGLAMVLGILAAVVFEISAVGSRFPFLEMVAWSLGLGLVLLAYNALHFLASR